LPRLDHAKGVQPLGHHGGPTTGVLAVTTRLPHPSPDDAPDVEETVVGGVPIYAHSPRHLRVVLADAGLVAVKQLDNLLGADGDRDIYRITVAARG
jgi:hypothetical protein